LGLGHIIDMWMRIFALSFCLSLLTVVSYGQENRSYSGYGNNVDNKEWGAAHTSLIRVSTPNYADGMMQINDADLPMPRLISNRLFDQKDLIPDKYNLSDYIWIFGQFLDHDITLVESNHQERMAIQIPADDEVFSPDQVIGVFRNQHMDGTGTEEGNPRQYQKEISSFIDGSVVYGSDEARASWLRTNNGDGKMKMTSDKLLPWNTIDGEFGPTVDETAPFMADETRSLNKFFVAGDIRANENPLLIALHTLFVREHNRLCDELIVEHPNWTGEQIYQRARKLVGGYIQSITYNEWLPAMGVHLPDYQGYNAEIDPSIFNVFSAAAFRIGHTMINSNLIRMNNQGGEINQGNISLRDAFFNPQAVAIAGGIDPYFKGMATQVMQKLDCKVIDDVRNFLFGMPGAGGMDLAAINIFRGRDRGLSDYNQLREDFGLPKVNTTYDFANPEDADHIESLYGSVDNIDAWVGMLAEKHISETIFGDLVMSIMERQFQFLRHGDRFYFENDPAFTTQEKNEINETTFHDIIMRNTGISLMQENVFLAMSHSDIPNGPVLSKVPFNATVYPNPVRQNTIIKVYAEKDLETSFRIFDSNGQVIREFTKDLKEGNNFIPLELEATLNPGVYNILIHDESDFSIVKLIKS